jgi:hypothetical protein
MLIPGDIYSTVRKDPKFLLAGFQNRICTACFGIFDLLLLFGFFSSVKTGRKEIEREQLI